MVIQMNGRDFTRIKIVENVMFVEFGNDRDMLLLMMTKRLLCTNRMLNAFDEKLPNYRLNAIIRENFVMYTQACMNFLRSFSETEYL